MVSVTRVYAIKLKRRTASIVFACLIIDAGASRAGYVCIQSEREEHDKHTDNDSTITSPIGIRNWQEHPFPDSYLGIKDWRLGQFLGFWTVIMQASFSFSGSEAPGIVRSSSGTIHLLSELMSRRLCRLLERSSTRHGCERLSL